MDASKTHVTLSLRPSPEAEVRDMTSRIVAIARRHAEQQEEGRRSRLRRAS